MDNRPPVGWPGCFDWCPHRGWVVVYNLNPQFGGKPTKAEIGMYSTTGHFENGKFINDKPIEMDIDCHSITKILKESFQPVPDIAPKHDIKIEAETILNKHDSLVRISWFGHSTFLVEIEGNNILLDPFFFMGEYEFNGRHFYWLKNDIEMIECENYGGHPHHLWRSTNDFGSKSTK